MNPVLQMLSKAQTINNAIKSPQNMVNSMIQNNPNLKEAMNLVRASGGNAKDAFYKLANEKGVNPDDVIKRLMG